MKKTQKKIYGIAQEIFFFLGYVGLALMIFIGFVYYISDVLNHTTFLISFILITLFLFASSSLSLRILDPLIKKVKK